jgi:hypothetical protein
MLKTNFLSTSFSRGLNCSCNIFKETPPEVVIMCYEGVHHSTEKNVDFVIQVC